VFYGSSYIKQKKIKHHFLLEVVNLILVIAVIYAIYEIGVYLFIEHQLVISIVSPLLTVIFAYFSSTAYHFISERSQSKMIKGMFSHYVSGTLVNELVQNPDKLKLGGEKRKLTILFSDIAGFTSISERMGAEELVEFINEYLTEMTKIVINNSGTLDKYIGDAIMAFWGAPLPMEDHALKACKTAVQMQKKLAVLREEWDLSEDQQIKIRIGLNTGEVVVGNIGGQNRFDYTVMGDTVNLASRLEGANKQYGTLNMISEYTYNVVKNDVVARELDNIRVKGKEKPTRVYELIGLQEDGEAAKKLEELKNYFEGLKSYQDANFIEAKKSFIKSAELLPKDGPSKLYLERCQYYIENPPEKDWNRVFIMKSK
jgi:adenylate cyclase